MILSLPAGSTGSRRTSMWIRCLGEISELVIWLVSQNGVLTLARDGEMLAKFTPQNTAQYGGFDMPPGDSIVQIIFAAQDMDMDSSGTVFEGGLASQLR